jgi:predicted nucleotide-binding protein
MNKHIDSLRGERIVFWSRGNGPTQQALGISSGDALIHLRALYLLADRVAAAASFYFESDMTRDVVKQVRPLLSNGDLLFFVNEDIDSFTEHGILKIEKSPGELTAYQDPHKVEALGINLDRSGDVLYRPSTDISARIVELWLDDLVSSEDGTLGAIVRQVMPGDAERIWWTTFLSSIGINRQVDFVWEYIEPLVGKAGAPPTLMRGVQRRLAQLYTTSTAEALGVHLDAPRYSARKISLDGESEYDTELFLTCLRCLGLYEAINRCTSAELIELKRSLGWRVFRAFYTDLIRYAISCPADMRDIIPILLVAERGYSVRSAESEPLTRDEFVRALMAMLQTVRPRNRSAKYKKLAERFGAIADAFDTGVFRLVWESLKEVRRDTIREADNNTFHNVYLPAHLKKGAKLECLRSFIVHGHDPEAVLELKNFLQNRLHWTEPIILHEQPSRGLTIIEKFEQHAQSLDVVFVLLTPDDVGTIDDKYRARQNVIFEMGYFVRHFGRKSGRVLLLTKGTIEIPSDLAGVIYIDISHGVVAASEHIRREVADLTRSTPRP